MELDGVIADKDCSFSAGTVLKGSDSLPIVIAKGKKL